MHLFYRLCISIVISLLFFTCSTQKIDKAGQPNASTDSKREKRILVFSKTKGWQHKSIPFGIAAVQKLGSENGFAVDTTKNADYFIEDSLQKYSAVVFLNTTRDVLDHRQQAEFERYIQAGGGFVGVHSAADTEYGWPWYNKLVGAWFESHPNKPNPSDQNGTLTVVDQSHISTRHLPKTWKRFDEWYSFKSMHPDVHVLITIDEKSYVGGTNGNYHPMAWYHEFDGGRAFYTSLGHTNESYSEPLYLQHLLGGIQYAIGENMPLDYSKARSLKVPDNNRFIQTVLAEGLNEPMELAVMPSGKVLFIERLGTIKLYDPSLKTARTIARLNVYSGKEDGLLGLTLDPNFEQNHWIYLFYSNPGPEERQHVSRFTMQGDSILFASEKILLQIPVGRKEANHSAGSLAFGPDGNLFISTGDNTVPFASDGYAPIDERPGRKPWDAQKSSGNTNDLRGKILRIKPQPDGSYSVPEGNLFAKDTPNTRPEIYVMGNRNPFRIAVDQKTGYLYWGEVGPDAGKDSTNRGPKGHDEVNQARKAGFFGWPFFVGNNKAYHDYDFTTQKSGELFKVEGATNDSPYSTGLKTLPPAQSAFIWYPYDDSKEFPIVGKGGRNAMAGPVYYYDQFTEAPKRFPRYYDGKLIIYDWMRNWVMAVTMDKEGNLQQIEPFLDHLTFDKPVDMQFGKDGSLYVLQYGTYWRSQNEDARLVKIDYFENNLMPVAKVQADQSIGATPLTVRFTSDGTFDHDKNDTLTYQWRFTGEAVQSTKANPTFTFTEPGVYKSSLTVTDSQGESNTSVIEIKAGNDPPVIAVDIKGNQSFYRNNQSLSYQVKVTDKEDGSTTNGTIKPERVKVTFNYLPQGKDLIVTSENSSPAATGSVLSVRGKALIDKSDCKACHALDKKSVGPSYTDVANRYQTDNQAVAKLAKKIITGGSGNWGEYMMSAHPQIKEEEAEEMVKYILSLKEQPASVTPAASLPLKGIFTTNKHNASSHEGSYLLSVSYTDKGAHTLPPLTTQKLITLRHPKVPAADADKLDNTARMNQYDSNSQIIRFTQDGASIGFHSIDLTGIHSLEVKYSSNGLTGIVEVRRGSTSGKLLGSFPIEPAGWTEKSIVIEPVSGSDELYIVYRDTAGTKQKATIWNTFNLDWIHFKTASNSASAK